jgi:hypothetical protein
MRQCGKNLIHEFGKMLCLLSGREDGDESDEWYIREKRNGSHHAASETPRLCIMFYLRVIDGHCLLYISIPDHSGLWDTKEKRGYPPNGE